MSDFLQVLLCGHHHIACNFQAKMLRKLIRHSLSNQMLYEHHTYNCVLHLCSSFSAYLTAVFFILTCFSRSLTCSIYTSAYHRNVPFFAFFNLSFPECEVSSGYHKCLFLIKGVGIVWKPEHITLIFLPNTLVFAQAAWFTNIKPILHDLIIWCAFIAFVGTSA